jgi:hypothetical protein
VELKRDSAKDVENPVNPAVVESHANLATRERNHVAVEGNPREAGVVVLVAVLAGLVAVHAGLVAADVVPVVVAKLFSIV